MTSLNCALYQNLLIFGPVFVFSDENQCLFFSYNELKQYRIYLKRDKIGQELAPLDDPERQIMRCISPEQLKP